MPDNNDADMMAVGIILIVVAFIVAFWFSVNFRDTVALMLLQA